MSGLLDGMPLVDHHCHGVVRSELNRHRFEAMLTEADRSDPLHGSLFDTQTGMGIRAVCAPLLDLPQFADADDYLARRRELGAEEVARRMLAASGIATYLVDTGLLSETLTSPAELAAYTHSTGREIVRLESIAEQTIVTTDPAQFPDAIHEVLQSRISVGAAGFKTVAAYRVGLDLDPTRPSTRDVVTAAGSWANAVANGAAVRLADETLTRFLIWTALDLGGPLQFHVGYGDADADLNRCDPLLLTPLLRACAGLHVPVMLLHNYPFHRHAGYLAQVFGHVFVDVGLALHNVGTRASIVLAEILELAPFGSVLFSSDAYGLVELYALHSTIFRQSLTAFLDDGITRQFWPSQEAERIARMITSDNALRAYRLDSR